MTSPKSPRRITASDVRMIMRIIPLVNSWKWVLLLVIVGAAVQYARNLPRTQGGGEPGRIEKSDVSEIDGSWEKSPENKPKGADGESQKPVSPAPEPGKPKSGEVQGSRSGSGKSAAEVKKEASEVAARGEAAGILDLRDLSDEKMKVGGVTIRDLSGKTVYRGTVDLKPTLERIDQGKRLSFSHDGSVFGNRERRLPPHAGEYYREWVHPTKGISGPGPQRIVTGKSREIFYTSDHYESFQKVR